MGFEIRSHDSVTQLSIFSFRIRKFYGSIVEKLHGADLDG